MYMYIYIHIFRGTDIHIFKGVIYVRKHVMYTTAMMDECPESCGDNAFCSPNTGYECQCVAGYTGNPDISCTGILWVVFVQHKYTGLLVKSGEGGRHVHAQRTSGRGFIIQDLVGYWCVASAVMVALRMVNALKSRF